MVFGLFKRKRLKKQIQKAEEKSQYSVPKVCGNCKFYREVKHDGVVGECRHDKVFHPVDTGKFDSYGKPIIYNMPLAVQPHFHCGMNCFVAR